MWRSNEVMYVTVPYNKNLFLILYFFNQPIGVDFGIALVPTRWQQHEYTLLSGPEMTCDNRQLKKWTNFVTAIHLHNVKFKKKKHWRSNEHFLQLSA